MLESVNHQNCQSRFRLATMRALTPAIHECAATADEQVTTSSLVRYVLSQIYAPRAEQFQDRSKRRDGQSTVDGARARR